VSAADERVEYPLRINDVDVPVKDAWVGESLLFVLRERLGLAGAKQGCGRGECGACTVLIDGSVTAACVFPAVAAQGRDVRTVEGLIAGSATAAHVRQGLMEAGAAACGVCLPGIVVAASALLTRNATPSGPAIREALSGNICHCVGIDRIVAAVSEAAARSADREAKPEAAS
jgi:aerobic-type carbon monoxide dehydrogenase small subunit (CoxS/CutS family)